MQAIKVNNAMKGEYRFPYDGETDDDLNEIETELSDNDNARIPHEVVSLMIKNSINLLATRRIYRNLSQQDATERVGLTQSAISQAERKAPLERLAEIYDCKPEQLTL